MKDKGKKKKKTETAVKIQTSRVERKFIKFIKGLSNYYWAK